MFVRKNYFIFFFRIERKLHINAVRRSESVINNSCQTTACGLKLQLRGLNCFTHVPVAIAIVTAVAVILTHANCVAQCWLIFFSYCLQSEICSKNTNPRLSIRFDAAELDQEISQRDSIDCIISILFLNICCPFFANSSTLTIFINHSLRRLFTNFYYKSRYFVNRKTHN